MRPDLPDIWSSVQAHLRSEVGDSVHGLWLERLRAVDFDGAVLTVEAEPDRRTWIAQRFGRVLQASAAAVVGPDVTVDLVAAGGPPPARGAASSRAARLSEPTLTFNPKYSFEQFVIGASNQLAHAAALAVAELPGQAYNPLFIHGSPGLGKTHLLHSIAGYVAAYGAGLTVRYATVETFTNDFVDALHSGSMERFKAAYRGADVLLLDDVQFLGTGSKARTEEELFHTFNELYESGSQVVLASDRPPGAIAGIDERLRERFACGLVTDVHPPDFAMRLTILRKRALLDGVELAHPAALELIADRVTANVRALEGALIRVVAFHSLTGRPIDQDLVDEVLTALPDTGSRPPQRSVRDIQDAVCARFEVSHDDLVSQSRVARVAWPRQIAMYLSRELTDQTLPTIGRHFGGRNHTTVLHAWRRTAERMQGDREAFDTVQGLLDSLAGPRPDRRR